MLRIQKILILQFILSTNLYEFYVLVILYKMFGSMFFGTGLCDQTWDRTVRYSAHSTNTEKLEEIFKKK